MKKTLSRVLALILAVLFIAIIAAEIGMLVSKKTPVDILVTPVVTLLAGFAGAWVFCPLVSYVMYFLGIFIAVHLEAKKSGLKGVSRDQLPHIMELIKDSYLLLPMIITFVSAGLFVGVVGSWTSIRKFMDV